MSIGIKLGIMAQAGVGSSGVTPVLDLYGTNIRVAYSVRKLSSTYTGDAIRVRETGFNTETDIGFDSNGDLDTAALLAHCASNGEGRIVTWYDQSGNGIDVTQGTADRQPVIVTGNAVVTVNGKPAGYRSTTSQFLQSSGFEQLLNTSDASNTSVGVVKYASSYRTCALGHDSATTSRRVGQIIRNGHTNATNMLRVVYFINNGGSSFRIDTSANAAYIGNQILQVGFSEGNGTKKIGIRYNGTEVATSTTTGTIHQNTNYITLFDNGRNVPSDFNDVHIQEILSYDTLKSDIADIETNINSYFSIYS